jgi:hypothetical protein
MLLRTATILLLVTAMTLSVGGSTANAAMEMEIVGQLDGWATKVDVSDGLAYVAIGTSVHVVDVTSPEAPTVVGRSDFLDTGSYFLFGLEASGEHVFVSAGGGGLRVIDVSVPAEPIEVAVFDTPGTARNAHVAGTRAYVADGDALRVVDISDPTEPQELGAIDTLDYATDVEVVDQLAYVAGGEMLRVIDVSDPDALEVVGEIANPDFGHTYGVDVGGGYAYLVGDELAVIDVSDPAAPTLVGAIPVKEGPAWDVQLVESTAFVTSSGCGVSGPNADCFQGGLIAIDVSDPTALAEVGVLETPDEADGVAVAEGYAYVGASVAGLRVVDVADPSDLQPVAVLDWLGSTRRVEYNGDAAVVLEYHPKEGGGGGGGWDVAVLRVSDPTDPVKVGATERLDIPGFANQLDVEGSRAYVAADGGLHIVDFSDPTEPYELGFLATADSRDVDVSESLACLANGGEGVQVIDISDPSAPLIQGNVDTPGSALGIQIAGSYAYVADGDGGLRVIDLSDPTAPQEVSSVRTSGRAEYVQVVDTYAYVASSEGSAGNLLVIDVSDPDKNVRKVSETELLGNPYSLHVAGSHVFVPLNRRGRGDFQVFDVSDPRAPTEEGPVDLPGHTFDIFVSGEYAYLTGAGGAFRVASVDTGELEDPGAVYLPMALVNAGGDAYEDGDGDLWSADQAFTSGSWGYTAGSAAFSSQEVSGTTDDALYQQYRVDPSEYRFDLENGDYRLTLHFAEFETDKFNHRIMEIVAEDSTLESSLSVVGEVGEYAALARTYPVSVADGQLNVHLTMAGGKLPPVVSAIEVDQVVYEPQPKVIVAPTSGLVTTEDGGRTDRDNFDVFLGSQPTANVAIGLSSSDTSEGGVSSPSPPSLIFTWEDWDTPQTVTVTGVDDGDTDGDIAYTIVTAAAVSDDPDYDGMDAADVSVTNLDNDEPDGSTHIGDLDGEATSDKNNWRATITILVHDNEHSPVADATVSGTWTAGASGTAGCTTTTNGSGVCTVTSRWVAKNVGAITFTVASVGDTLPYEAADNHDDPDDGDSDGTTITVSKP